MIVWPSIEVQELRESNKKILLFTWKILIKKMWYCQNYINDIFVDSPGLLKLHEDFLGITSEKPIKVVTFSERESTYITALKFELQFVDSHSAYPDVGENFGIPLDHLCICKPCGRCGIYYNNNNYYYYSCFSTILNLLLLLFQAIVYISKS